MYCFGQLFTTTSDYNKDNNFVHQYFQRAYRTSGPWMGVKKITIRAVHYFQTHVLEFFRRTNRKKRVISYKGATTWNSIPPKIHKSPNLMMFKQHMISHIVSTGQWFHNITNVCNCFNEENVCEWQESETHSCLTIHLNHATNLRKFFIIKQIYHVLSNHPKNNSMSISYRMATYRQLLFLQYAWYS